MSTFLLFCSELDFGVSVSVGFGCGVSVGFGFIRVSRSFDFGVSAISTWFGIICWASLVLLELSFIWKGSGSAKGIISSLIVAHQGMFLVGPSYLVHQLTRIVLDYGHRWLYHPAITIGALF